MRLTEVETVLLCALAVFLGFIIGVIIAVLV